MTRICEDCGASFTSRRCDARHCSSACKQRAYRDRGRQRLVADPLRRRADAVLSLIRAGELDPWLGLSYVVAPPREMVR
jgi:hypothetical protein